MTFSIHHESRGYRLQWQDGWSMGALGQALEQVAQESQFRHCRVLIHDLGRTGSALPADPEGGADVAAVLGRHFKSGKLVHALVSTDAAVVAAYSAPFGLAQIELEVFASYHDASVWADASTGFSDLMDSMLFDDEP